MSGDRLARFAEIALLAWYATGGNPDEGDPTDAWNDLCARLELEPESFPDECREVLAAVPSREEEK